MPTPSSDPPDELPRELREATAGLLYPSESDEPFDVIALKATETDVVRQLAAVGRTVEPLTETSVDDFFAEMVAGEAGERYRQLRRLLESRLTGLRVLRAGEVRVDVYLIGKTRQGDWAGLHTLSIET